MIYSEKINVNKAAFFKSVEAICRRMEIKPDWLMGVMAFETAGTFSTSIKNKYSGAVGLIQFMPDTAISMGTTVEAMAAMSNLEQLSYVYEHLFPYRGKMKSFVDVYFAVFFPRAIGKGKNYVMETVKLSAALIARQNPGYDLNKDQQITVQEVETVLLSKIPKNYHPYLT